MSANKSQKQDMGARQPTDHLVVGRIARPHGVRGALVVDPASKVIESLRPESVVFLGEIERSFKIESIRPHRKRYLISLERITDRNEAELYRDLEVKLSYQDSEPLDEHEYYFWQIIGLQVETDEGETLGEVINIIETGANDVYVVRSEADTELLLPAIEDVILSVDLNQERLLVHLLPGLSVD